MKVVLIGAGFAGQMHAKALKALGITPYGIITSKEATAKAFAEEWNIPNYSDSISLALAPEVTHVHICTPPATHTAFLCQLLAAGKQVLCEKPLCLTEEEIQTLLPFANQASASLALTYNVRYYSAIAKAKELLSSGEFGKPLLIHGNYLQEFHALPAPYDWRYKEDLAGKMRAVTEIGSHWFDIAQYLTGSKITRLQASFQKVCPERILFDGTMTAPSSAETSQHDLSSALLIASEDAAAVTLSFDNGMMGNVFLSEISHGRGNHLFIEITCEYGSIWWNEEEANRLYTAKKGEGICTQLFPFDGGFNDTFYSLIKDFHGERSDALPSLSDGAGITRICNAAFQSACNDSKWIPVPAVTQAQNDVVQKIIQTLHLIPLPEEGGLHAQTYVSRYTTDSGEAAGTAIYYLLTPDTFSHMHCLTGDEIYHFYLGDPVELLELLPDGSAKVTRLGPDILRGEEVQHLVPSGVYQGSRLVPGGTFALLGTTMCPGYTDASYTHGDHEDLQKRYPDAKKRIQELT